MWETLIEGRDTLLKLKFRKRPLDFYAYMFEIELLNEQGKKLYDKEFLENMSKKHNEHRVLSDKYISDMLLLDVIILLFSNEKRFSVKILTLDIESFPATIEVLLIFSSLFYMSYVLKHLNKSFNEEVIKKY